MPKKKLIRELEEGEEYEGMEEEELEEEEVEVLKKQVPVRVKPKPKPKVPAQRYVAFNQAQRMGIADNETGEVVAEGEFSILQALAKMMGQLENIENNLGSMMES